MVKNPDILFEFEAAYARRNHMGLPERLKIWDDMHELAVNLGVLPPIENLLGLKEKIQILRQLKDADRVIKENRPSAPVQ